MSLNLQKGKPRTLAYGAALRQDFKLLEVTDDLLEELQEHGLCFKGGQNEEAVLCSATQTFAVKNVETSNLVLLVEADPPAQDAAGSPAAPQPTPPGQLPGLATQLLTSSSAAENPPVTVSAIVASHLELVRVAPRFANLDAALATNPIGADERDNDSNDDKDVVLRGLNGPVDASRQDAKAAKPFACPIASADQGQTAVRPAGATWHELLEIVQASAAELADGLEQRGAVCVDGLWRGVDATYLGTLLELLLLTVIEQGWHLDAVPAAGAIAALEEHNYPAIMTLHCLKRFGERTVGEGGGEPCHVSDADGTADMDTRSVWRLRNDAVCRHFGIKLLEEQARWDDTDAFMAAWRHAVPDVMTPDIEMLRGEALVDAAAASGGGGGGGGEGIKGLRRFSVATLPQDAASRFAALFGERPRWALPALEPYIEGLAGPGETRETLLLKYARASQQRPTDPVTYSAR